MKVYLTEDNWYDVYFKTETSGNQFINYLSTVIGKEFHLYESKIFSAVVIRREVTYDYPYKLSTHYLSVVDSYLEMFPEENEL